MGERTDRELLELAAKAAGFDVVGAHNEGLCLQNPLRLVWNPLTDDGDALRLAVKLGITIDTSDGVNVMYVIKHVAYPINEYEFADIYAATRRAIVRAAAAIELARRTTDTGEGKNG